MNYFIVTTPLQYLNVLNIDVVGKRCVLILGGFCNSEQFYNDIVVKNNLWDLYKYFEKYNLLYQYVIQNVTNEDKLFIDSDYGIITNNKLRKVKSKEIYVYEEGVGSYRSDLISKNRSWLKKNILKIFGNKEFFGGSKFVKGIYVYDHEKHINKVPDFDKERLHFKNPFSVQVERNISNFLSTDLIEKYRSLIRNRDVLLYITSWSYNVEIENYILKKNQGAEKKIIILKPHPHFKDFDKIQIQFDDVVKGEILVEMLFILLKEYSKDFVVLHENSSALQYYSSIKNISF